MKNYLFLKPGINSGVPCIPINENQVISCMKATGNGIPDIALWEKKYFKNGSWEMKPVKTIPFPILKGEEVKRMVWHEGGWSPSFGSTPTRCSIHYSIFRYGVEVIADDPESLFERVLSFEKQIKEALLFDL